MLRVFLDDHLWQIVGCVVLMSAGTAIAYAAMPTLVLAAARPAQRSAANGLNALARTLGTSLSSAVFGALAVGTAVTVLPTAGAYPLSFPLGAVATVGALVATAFIRVEPAAGGGGP